MTEAASSCERIAIDAHESVGNRYAYARQSHLLFMLRRLQGVERPCRVTEAVFGGVRAYLRERDIADDAVDAYVVREALRHVGAGARRYNDDCYAMARMISGRSGPDLRMRVRFDQPTTIAYGARSSAADFGDCSVCLEHIARGTQTALDCGHVFHTGCLAEWLQQSANAACPYCRTNVVVFESAFDA